MSDLKLENGVLQALFDSATGALLSLAAKRTGWHIQGRGGIGPVIPDAGASAGPKIQPGLGYQITAGPRRTRLESKTVTADHRVCGPHLLRFLLMTEEDVVHRNRIAIQPPERSDLAHVRERIG